MYWLFKQLVCLPFLGLSLPPNTVAAAAFDTSLHDHYHRPRQLDRVKLGDVPYGEIIFSCTTPNTIALTFDDGPSLFTSDVLDALSGYPEAKVTFFVNGDNFSRGPIDNRSLPWPGLLSRMHATGHQIGSHGWRHIDLSPASSKERYDEVVQLEKALKRILGFYPTYFRPPYGWCPPDCQDDLGELGYHIINFDCDTKDYEHDSPDVATGIQVSMDIFGTWAGDGSIVLAHDVYASTAETLVPYMLEVVAERGWRMVTVGECLGDPANNWYRS